MDKAIIALKQGITIELQGHIIKADISPCSFMNKTYGLQLSLLLMKGDVAVSREYVHNPAVFPETATEADVQAMLEGVKFQVCPCCGTPTFVSTNKYDNRKARCEQCAAREFRAELDKIKVAEDAKFKRQCDKMKAQGMKYMVDIVVHSTGDDKVVTHFMSDLPTDMIKFAKKAHPRAVQLDIGNAKAL